MTPEMFERLINAIDSTDWISNVIGIFSIVIPICYAISISKKDTKELDERQKKLEEIQGDIRDNIKLLSEYQVKIGLYEKRLNLYHFFKDLGDDWVFLYEMTNKGNNKGNNIGVPLNYYCKENLKQNSNINRYSQSELDELVRSLTENHNKLVTNFENMEIYFSFSVEQLELLTKIKKDLIEIYSNLLKIFNISKSKRLSKIVFENKEIIDLYNIFNRSEYFDLVEFLKKETVVNFDS